jgi:hypothetical protein
MKHLSAEKFNVDLNHPKAKFYSSFIIKEDKYDKYKNRNKNIKTVSFSNTSKKSEKEKLIDLEKENDINQNYMAPILTFHQLRNSNSKITCNNVPSLKKLDKFVETYGINSILSCNEDNYYRNYIRKEAKSLNLYYLEIRIDLNSMNLFKYKSYRDNFISDINDLYDLLMNKNLTLLINSSCGEKRLAIIVFCLLVKNGEKPQNAFDILLALKKINKSTYQDSNIDLLIKFVLPYL